MRPEARDTRHTIGLLCEQPHLDALAPSQRHCGPRTARHALAPTSSAWELFQHANRAIHGHYVDDFDDHFTLLVPSLRIIAEFRPYTNLCLALGGNSAIRSPSRSLRRTVDDETRRCNSTRRQSADCRSTCDHILYPKDGHFALCFDCAPSDAHTESAYSVFITSFATFPFQYTSILQLEGWVYRIAMTSTFRERARGPEEYRGGLDKLVGIWAACRISCGS
ncbi:fungal transcriptional regulatory protein [Penicillium subrubescens]|uniref:fungal transcriptional regulatory protein n=1 Tax=Penicillium subrubescens TaxID=1316194 RepID=UPI002544D8AA|nr:fungal transcriptional regulatory protein [Penicillium subrubescens]KAJ5900284.1 fungal transcriptional regulatory protein [Penicillium subrubescens]